MTQRQFPFFMSIAALALVSMSAACASAPRHSGASGSAEFGGAVTVRGIDERGPSADLVLVDGLYEGDHRAAGFVERSTIRADIDGDGVEDVLALLWENGGASGTFLYLVWFSGATGLHASADAVFLGDRIRVEAMTPIDGGRSVELRYVYAGDEDPMCCPGARRTVRFSASGARLAETFRREDGRASLSDLEGADWMLVGFEQDSRSVALDRIAMSASGSGDSFSVRFEDGKVSGKGSCNRYFGQVAPEPGLAFSIGGMGSTRMFCADESLDLREDEYLGALGAAKQWAIWLGRLELYSYGADGAATTMTFEHRGL